MKRPSGILIVTLNYFGDILMTAPLIDAVRQSFSGRLAVCAGEKGKGVRRLINGVDRWIFRGASDNIFNYARVASEIRDFGAETILLLRNSKFTHRLARQSGAARVFSSSVPLVSGLHIDKVPMGEDTVHITHKALKYAEAMGISLPDTGVEINAGPEKPCAAYGKYALLFPGTTRRSKMWDMDSWLSLGRMIYEKRGCLPVFMGSPSDKAISVKLREAGYPHKDLIGLTGVGQLAAFIKNAGFVVSVDNGAMHLADIMGVPTVALFGSTDPAVVGPLSASSAVVGPAGVCVRCGRHKCRLKENTCLRGISAEMVFDSIESL